MATSLVVEYRQCDLNSVGRPSKPLFINNRLVVICHTKSVIAILVPKLVAMAASLAYGGFEWSADRMQITADIACN